MKTEGEFNAWLKKRLDRYKPELQALKISDRFQGGVSDFMLFGFGEGFFFETKFIKEAPTGNKKILKHEFGLDQISFLQSMADTGHTALGMIGFGDTKRIAILPDRYLAKNWKTPEFMSNIFVKWITFNDVMNVTTGKHMLEVLRYEQKITSPVA